MVIEIRNPKMRTFGKNVAKKSSSGSKVIKLCFLINEVTKCVSVCNSHTYNGVERIFELL